jgi:hypothetical protein
VVHYRSLNVGSFSLAADSITSPHYVPEGLGDGSIHWEGRSALAGPGWSYGSTWMELD